MIIDRMLRNRFRSHQNDSISSQKIKDAMALVRRSDQRRLFEQGTKDCTGQLGAIS